MGLMYLVRHGENRANVERVFSHRVVDYSLTERGVEQARAVARRLAGHRLARVYSSPLRRARETAEPIAAATGAPIVVAEALRELACGELDGRGDEEAWTIHDEILARWRAGEWEARFPGGESYREAHDRLADFLAELAERHADEDVAVVGHGGLFFTVLPRLCPIPLEELVGLRNTSVTVLRHHEAALSCELWGCIEHLAEA
jgi:broad specificity phosphatase PhoE